MPILFIFSFLAGVCTMLSPCILPILPIVLAAGASKGAWRSLGVSIGLVISFTFFTLTLTSIVQAFGISANLLRNMAIGLVFLFGLFLVIPSLSQFFYNLATPVARIGERLQQKGPKEGFVGGLVLGFALGLLWTPCAGPILAAISAFIATQSITLLTVGLILAYVIGAAIPLFFIAWGGGAILRKFLTAHTEEIRRFFGGVTILVAISMVFHWDEVAAQKLGQFVPPILIEDNLLVQGQLEKLQQGIKTGNAYDKAPELMGVSNWINSRPLSLQELKGKVVLIDFWTYTCINCLRTLPYIKEWYAKYNDKGFVVIGVHTPEFEFEKSPINVMAAVSRLGITYPVAQDNNYRVWQAYHNHYWPAHYLIDQHGAIVSVHYGEGGYAEMEGKIRELLHLPQIAAKDSGLTPRAISPETYLGTNRGERFTSENSIIPNEVVLYNYEKPLPDDQVGLKGHWRAKPECITAEGDACRLEYNFLGKQVYLVLSGSSAIPIEVVLDGKKVKEISVDTDRKYDIVDTDYGRHLLSLKVPKGISAYAFTFGDEK